jgi:hypothetical protein
MKLDEKLINNIKGFLDVHEGRALYDIGQLPGRLQIISFVLSC